MSGNDEHDWYGSDYKGHRHDRGHGRGRRHYHGNRGGRGGRGGGGHHQRYFTMEEENSGSPEGGQFERAASRSRGGGRGRPPPGLRGRELGMWYARRSKQKKEVKEREQRPVVAMDTEQEDHIQRLLHNIRTSEDDLKTTERLDTGATGTTGEDWFEDTGSKSNRHKVSRHKNQHSNYSALKEEHSSDWRRSEVKGYDTQASTMSGTSVSSAMPLSEIDQSEGEETEGSELVSTVTELMQYNTEEDYMVKEQEEDLDAVLTESLHQGPVLNEEYLAINDELRHEFLAKQRDRKYCAMRDFRTKLPAFDKCQDILDKISENQVLVISGETGCGKTTQVPQFILDDYLKKGIGSQCRIFCTQPRRISAVSVADRVAAERAEQLGQSTGYMIRLEHKMPRQNASILFCTTGIMLRILESDPLLKKASHIILDEIHERDLLSDFLIIILRDILLKRPDLKLILMSATLNAEAFSRYFNDSPMLHIPGFTYPVKEYLLEDVIETLQYEPSEKMLKNEKSYRMHGKRGREKRAALEEQEWNLQAWLRNIQGRYSDATLDVLRRYDTAKVDIDLIHQLIRYIVSEKEDGAILAFLPGWGEISDLNKLLEADPLFKSDKFLIIPLHSLMPTLNQKKVFERPPRGVRKIVIATNIAETSITIDDVVYVIDGGKIKVKDYDAETNMSSLASQWVSKANAKQRRGRAGRVQPGECYHLYSSLQETQLLDYLPPEILRTRLEELCLQIKLLKLGKIEKFVKKALQAPSLQALQRAIVNLQNLNALDQDENLLPLGHHLARMPLDPHMGKMILFGAMFCCLDPILTVAASLSFKDAFYVPLGKERLAEDAKKRLADGCHSDHIMLVNAFQGWERAVQTGNNRQYCWQNFLSENTLRLLRDMKKQLAELLQDLGFLNSRNPKDQAANINSGSHLASPANKYKDEEYIREADRINKECKENIALVKAVLCAGLYPNVAKIKSAGKKNRPMRLLTKSEGRCEMHPKSVNMNIQEPESQWVVYHMIMKTSGVFIYDSTLVSPYPLLFFGGEIDTLQEYGMDHVSVDDWIRFKASPKTATLVKELRYELDRLLEEKITNPGVTNWSSNSKEGALLNAIIHLVTTDEEKRAGWDDEKNYSSDDWRRFEDAHSRRGQDEG